VKQEDFTWTYNENDNDNFTVDYGNLPHGHFIELMKKDYEIRDFQDASDFRMLCAGAYGVY
jgi:hypothetical protein